MKKKKKKIKTNKVRSRHLISGVMSRSGFRMIPISIEKMEKKKKKKKDKQTKAKAFGVEILSSKGEYRCIVKP